MRLDIKNHFNKKHAYFEVFIAFFIIYYELFVIYYEVYYNQHKKGKGFIFMGYYTDQEQRSIIANNLSKLIELSQKEQKDIAIELDVNPPTFNQWVNGKAIPNISMLRKVAEYFNIGLSDIIDKHTDSEYNLNPTTYELKMISAYRSSPVGIKEAIDKLLLD